MRKAFYQIDELIKEKFQSKSTSNEVNDKGDYCLQVIQVVESQPQIKVIPAVTEKLNVL